MTAPTPTATINPFRGPGPAAAPAEKAPAQAGSPGFVTQKFFVEAWEDYHRDKRFGTPRARVKVAVKDPITGRTHQMSEPGAPRHEVRAALTDLVAAWSAFAAATHTTAWLAHGTLMGWWWSGAALPWDDDIDLQMTLRDLETLAARHHGARWGDDGRFLLEVNPNRIHRWHEKPNAIDARFIDTKTGRFLDITALASSVDPADAMRNPPDAQMWLTCKSLHFYDFRDLFPLRRSTFEGIDVYVPFNVKRVLQMEYGGSSVSRTSFRNHEYNTTSKTWVQMPSS
ncbi:LicD family-domain-containing protein [Zopfochytrium polystomum]|nr:LicD family-domain-containing protein [Zopfochytrium polystomum]